MFAGDLRAALRATSVETTTKPGAPSSATDALQAQMTEHENSYLKLIEQANARLAQTNIDRKQRTAVDATSVPSSAEPVHASVAQVARPAV